MRRVQVQFSDAQLAALRQLSASREVSVAAVVRDAVDRSIAEQPAGDAVERALAYVGGFRSGLTHVSEHHDDELVDLYG